MSERYSKVSDGILDTKTNLVWHKETKEKLTWQEAMAYAKSLGSGWRLPTIEELTSVLDYSKVDPATGCPGFQSIWYWSSSSHAGYNRKAWYAHFSDGYVVYYDKRNSNATRCVRDATEKDRNV